MEKMIGNWENIKKNYFYGISILIISINLEIDLTNIIWDNNGHVNDGHWGVCTQQ
jgi:hypothetical protein